MFYIKQMIIIRDLFGNKNIIQPCTMADSLRHIKKISNHIPDQDKESLLERMKDCIEEHTAFHINNDCFLYYQMYNKYIAIGISLYGKNHPLKLLTLFTGIFLKQNPKLQQIKFQLHDKNTILTYKSILTLPSIQRNYFKNSPVIVPVNKLKEKILSLYKHRGLQWEVY